MLRRGLIAALVATSLAAAPVAAGCGGGDDGEDLAEEDSVRQCLVDAGFEIEPAGLTPSPELGSVDADFRAIDGELAVEIVVLGNSKRAENAEADVRAALAGFGAAEAEVVRERNALAVFGTAPDEGQSSAVQGCLAG